jgi:hypothetical protein
LPFATSTAPGSARFDLELPAAFFADLSAMAVSSSGKLKGVLDSRRPGAPLQ